MRYVITGGSGYIGTRLVEHLITNAGAERVVIADVRPPASPRPNVVFEHTDVTDRAAISALLEREQPDALVHLAFLLNPIHDDELMYDVDVNGTFNALEAAAKAGTQHVLVTSSTTAYGAFPDNPEPIEESWPVRGVPNFSYARHKTEADRLCQLWAAEHPDRTMTIVRPCIVFGPNVENYIVRSWEDAPFFAKFRGLPEQRVQFVHEEDVVDAITGLLDGRHGGAFNVTGDGVLTWSECAELAGVRERTVPYGLYYRLGALLWKLRVKGVETPPGNLEFVRHPWVASNEKVKATLGWTPKHTSRETFLETMRARGIGPAAAAEARIEAPASSNGASAPERERVG